MFAAHDRRMPSCNRRAGEGQILQEAVSHEPARRAGTVGDVAQAVIFALTNTFLTRVTLAVDGGELLT